MYPSIAEYNQLILNSGGQAFKTLFELSFIPSRTIPFKVFTFGSGAYAVVFKAINNNKTYAVRCFLTAENENIERYRHITSYLKSIEESWITEVYLFENEIALSGKYYPVIIMDWVDGVLLNKYVNQIKSNNELLTALQAEIIAVSKSLESNKVGHGDIQSGNIIITNDSTGKAKVKLIDYDGMFVPSLINKQNLERGRAEFQHPNRNQLVFNEKIDRFSFWVILCALEALKFDKDLWLEVMQGGFNTLDNMLFTGKDFANTQSSVLFNRLTSINQPSLNFYLSKLKTFCVTDPNKIESVKLYDNLNTEENTEINKEPEEVSNNDTLKIISFPSGANIYTSEATFLGTTPFYIEKHKYLNQSLTIAHLNQIKRVLIQEDSTQIFAHFPQVNGDIADISRNVVTPQPFSPSPLPTSTNTTPINPVPQERENWGWVIGAIVFFLFLVIAIVAYKNEQFKQENSSTTETYQDNSNILPVDTTAPVVADTSAPYNETILPAVRDTSGISPLSNNTSESENTDVSNSDENSSILNTKDISGMTAEEKLYAFFIALNNKNCKEAWNYTMNPIWEQKGENWFCSSSAFGTVTEIRPGEIIVKSYQNTIITLAVDYYAADYINGNKCFSQIFTLTLLGTPNYRTWMITRVKNNTPPYLCD